jgi:hypothetical protein
MKSNDMTVFPVKPVGAVCGPVKIKESNLYQSFHGLASFTPPFQDDSLNIVSREVGQRPVILWVYTAVTPQTDRQHFRSPSKHTGEPYCFDVVKVTDVQID